MALYSDEAPPLPKPKPPHLHEFPNRELAVLSSYSKQSMSRQGNFLLLKSSRRYHEIISTITLPIDKSMLGAQSILEEG